MNTIRLFLICPLEEEELLVLDRCGRGIKVDVDSDEGQIRMAAG